MNILFLSDQPNPPGYIPRVRYFADYFRREGYRVDWVSESPKSTETLAKMGVRGINYVGESRLGWLWKPLLNLIFDHKGRYFFRRISKDFDAKGYDIIICSTTFNSFPATTAAMLAERFGKPLVVDLRDILEQAPAESNHIFRHKLPGFLGNFIGKLYKSRQISRRNRALKAAKALTSVSSWHCDFLKQFCPSTYLIYNGFDERVFREHHMATQEFRLAYFGEIRDTNLRHPNLLFQAIRNLKERGLLCREFVVDWFTCDDSAKVIDRLAKEHGIAELMRYNAYVAENRLVEKMQRSALLLIFSHNPQIEGYHGIMTTKFFEYVGVGKPILLSPNNRDELSEKLSEISAGIASSDTSEIEQFILEKQAEWQAESYLSANVSKENRSNLSRLRSAEQMSAVVDSLVQRKD